MLTEAQAKAKGAELLRGLNGTGWELKVFENCGWHYTACNKFISVHPSRGGKYFAMMTADEDRPGVGEVYWRSDGSFDTPQEAVEAQLQVARNHFDKVRQAVEYVEKHTLGRL